MSTNILTQHGLSNAAALVTAAQTAGVPLWIAAAVIEKESNGLNVYGNDTGGVYSTGDPARPNPNKVTEANYRRFESRVLAGETSNGVGPAQITWPGFIRDAKDRGIRLWVPAENMLYGMSLIAGYLNGSTSDRAIRYAGTRYNGSELYGNDLLVKARRWQERLSGGTVATKYPAYPARSKSKTNSFYYDLATVLRSEGYQIYDDPTYVDRGYCYRGAPNHGHQSDSRHFVRRAVDFGRDPGGAGAVSNYERAYVDAKILMLQDLYGGAMGYVWNRGAGDHEDHGHLQDIPLPASAVKLTGKKVSGVTLYGATGSSVKSWQRDLNKVAKAGLTEDGVFRLNTFWATKKWQAKRGLTPDGIIGSGSRVEMAKNLRELEEDEKTYNDRLTKAEVTKAQNMLGRLGFNMGKLDGVVGPTFVAGVKAFQIKAKLNADGIYGPKTRAALEAAVAELDKPKPEPKPDLDPVRIYGENRWETAAAAMTTVLPDGPGLVLAADDTTDLGMATVIAAQAGVDLLPVRRGAESLPSAIKGLVETGEYTWIRVVGGPSAVPDSAVIEAFGAADLMKELKR